MYSRTNLLKGMKLYAQVIDTVTTALSLKGANTTIIVQPIQQSIVNHIGKLGKGQKKSVSMLLPKASAHNNLCFSTL